MPYDFDALREKANSCDIKELLPLRWQDVLTICDEIDLLRDMAKRMGNCLKGLSVDDGFDFYTLFPEFSELVGE